MEKRCSFELFKSNVCHWLKEEGDIDFLIQVLESDLIRKYYNRKWYLESFYLLGMLDYISRINDVPMCSEYDDLRQQRMQEIVYWIAIGVNYTEVSTVQKLMMEQLHQIMQII